MNKKKSNIRELCMVGLASSLICVIAPISILLPLGVPMTLQSRLSKLAPYFFDAKIHTESPTNALK